MEDRDSHISHTLAMYSTKAAIFPDLVTDDLSVKPNVHCNPPRDGPLS